MTALAPISLRQPLDRLAAALGEAFTRTGFAVVSEHGIDPALVGDAEQAMRALFGLPAAVKESYIQHGQAGARGYTPFGKERAKGAAVHDLKEFWHTGREFPAGATPPPGMAHNLWPAEVPQFREVTLQLFAAFEQAGEVMLRAISRFLGLAEDTLGEATQGGNSVLRYLHYPPLAAPESGAIRAAAHADINVITLLLGAEEAGLELLTREGAWLPVAAPAGALVVNIGDMLERLTGGRLPSTLHRVVNPSGAAAQRSRYSMPFFLHFRPDYLIAPPGGEPAITADAFLQQRLREIGLAA